MLLVSEPEAAAIYTARLLKEEHGADFFKVRKSNTRLMIAMTYIKDRKASALCYVMQVEEQLYVNFL